MKKVLTKDQVAWRESILGKRFKAGRVKPKYVMPGDDLIGVDKTFWYMENCIFWMKEFKEGRAEKEKAISAIKSMRNLCTQAENYIANQKTKSIGRDLTK